MTKYSYPQLEGLWIANGGSSTTAAMAAAIAMAESGGNSDSHSSTNDYGLWQINNGGAAMYDPNANARRAIQMSQNGVNWRPWCTAYSDNACGTRGGAYLGPGASFHQYLTGTPPQGIGGSPYTGPADGGGVQLAGSSSNPDDACLIGLPLPSLGPIGGGQACLIKHSQGRAALGAVCLVGGSFVMLIGAALVLTGTRGARQILQILPSPGAQVAGRASEAAAEQGAANRAAAPTSSAGGRQVLGVSRGFDESNETMSRDEARDSMRRSLRAA